MKKVSTVLSCPDLNHYFKYLSTNSQRTCVFTVLLYASAISKNAFTFVLLPRLTKTVLLGIPNCFLNDFLHISKTSTASFKFWTFLSYVFFCKLSHLGFDLNSSFQNSLFLRPYMCLRHANYVFSYRGLFEPFICSMWFLYMQVLFGFECRLVF